MDDAQTDAPKSVTLSDGSVWTLEVSRVSGRWWHRIGDVLQLRLPQLTGQLPLTAADHRKIADVLDPPAALASPRATDWERICAWALKADRQPATLAFTAGAERQIAYALEYRLAAPRATPAPSGKLCCATLTIQGSPYICNLPLEHGGEHHGEHADPAHDMRWDDHRGTPSRVTESLLKFAHEAALLIARIAAIAPEGVSEREAVAWCKKYGIRAVDGAGVLGVLRGMVPASPSLASATAGERCPRCAERAIEVTEESEIQWGGGRAGEIGFVAKIVAPHWHCANCDEDWCDHRQSEKREAALLHALYADWQALKKSASATAGERPELGSCSIPFTEKDRREWASMFEMQLLPICNPKNVKLLIERYEATVRDAEKASPPVPEVDNREAIAAINKACAIIELGDQRLLASDGPAGGQPPDLTLKEWRTLYVTLDNARKGK